MQKLNKIALAIAGVTTGVSSFAAGSAPDFSTLTGSIDLSSIGTAVLFVAGLMVGPKVIAYGARRVLAFLGRG